MRPAAHLSFALIAALGLPAVALATEPATDETAPIRIFVMAPQVSPELGVPDTVIESVLTARVARLEKLKRFSFISRSEANEVLRQVGLRQLTGDENDDAMLKQVGDALRADRVVSTVVGSAGAANVVSVTLMNTAESKAEKRIARVVKGDAQFILTGANEAADELLAYLIRTYADLAGVTPVRTAPIAAANTTPPEVSTPWGRYAGFALVGTGVGVAALGGVFVVGDNLANASVAPVFGAAAVLAALGVTAILVSPAPHVVVPGAGGDAPLFVPTLAVGPGGARVGLSAIF